MNEPAIKDQLENINYHARKMTRRLDPSKGNAVFTAWSRPAREREFWYDAIQLARACEAIIETIEEQNEELRAERAAWPNPVFVPHEVKS